MTRLFLILICVVSSSAATRVAAEAADRPNIVFFFIDDWAWNGSPVPMDGGMANSAMPALEMPNLERLAREGMTFRNAYASPQCSPSRVCVQTGQSSPRNGYTVYMNDKGQEYYDAKGHKKPPTIPCIADQTIDPDAVTIPEALASQGYASAHIGKWHMRGDPADEGYLVHDGDTNNNPGNTIKGSKALPADLVDPKLMFSVTEDAIAFMEDQVAAERPFYLQISHYAMHAGSECLPATREKYAKHPLVQAWYAERGKTADTIRRKEDPAVWLGMGEDLDGRIGAVLDRIDSLGIADDTYVVLMSDNGYRHKFLPGLTQPHWGHKWWAWQGGIRVPMFARGPGIGAGTRFAGNVTNYDLLPTFVAWSGGDPTSLDGIDGVSLAPYMAGAEPPRLFAERNLYFHYPHYRGSSLPHSAIVSDRWKVMHFYGRPELPILFDLAEDQGESHNIAAERPEEHSRLHGELFAYLDEVGARLPKTNPDYDPEYFEGLKDYKGQEKYGPFEGRREQAGGDEVAALQAGE
ncbi:MAG: sulfatase-like hydrolase/transferase [Planctomycetota bacterium]